MVIGCGTTVVLYVSWLVGGKSSKGFLHSIAWWWWISLILCDATLLAQTSPQSHATSPRLSLLDTALSVFHTILSLITVLNRL